MHTPESGVVRRCGYRPEQPVDEGLVELSEQRQHVRQALDRVPGVWIGEQALDVACGFVRPMTAWLHSWVAMRRSSVGTTDSFPSKCAVNGTFTAFSVSGPEPRKRARPWATFQVSNSNRPGEKLRH